MRHCRQVILAVVGDVAAVAGVDSLCSAVVPPQPTVSPPTATATPRIERKVMQPPSTAKLTAGFLQTAIRSWLRPLPGGLRCARPGRLDGSLGLE
jgi:hypothetical protein